MKLRYQIPKFYIKRYGEDSEINDFCAKIVEVVADKQYSSKTESVDFIPILVPDEMIAEGLGEEFTKYDLKYKLVALGRQIKFDDYVNGDTSTKKKLLIECLFKGLEEIKGKSKLDIDSIKVDINAII